MIETILTLLISLLPAQAETITFTRQNYIYPHIKENYCLIVDGDYCDMTNHELDTKIFREKVAEERAEKERLEQERLERERLEQIRLASLPKTINFDEVFGWVDVGCNNMDLASKQVYVDAGYILKDWSDYFHHNTSGFMKLFNNIKVGDTVIIGGQTYKAVSFHNGVVTEDNMKIILEDGSDAFRDEYVQIITCNGPVGTRYRYLWKIEEV